mmetsp:Transcript_31663/g.64356  ORF Transcript_31663/g.64356 Transcript_31663/m.64356 type:complete len:229 (-) Transcript_31663:1011-1697(-)
MFWWDLRQSSTDLWYSVLVRQMLGSLNSVWLSLWHMGYATSGSASLSPLFRSLSMFESFQEPDLLSPPSTLPSSPLALPFSTDPEALSCGWCFASDSPRWQKNGSTWLCIKISRASDTSPPASSLYLHTAMRAIASMNSNRIRALSSFTKFCAAISLAAAFASLGPSPPALPSSASTLTCTNTLLRNDFVHFRLSTSFKSMHMPWYAFSETANALLSLELLEQAPCRQ